MTPGLDYKDIMSDSGLTLFKGPPSIRRAVRRMAGEIDRDAPEGPLLMIGVLKGSFMFLADLLRSMTSEATVDFVRLCSYGAGTRPGRIRMVKDVESPVRGRNIVIVDDIVDTGLTTRFLLRHFGRRRPASLRVCALLDKPSRRRVKVPLHYLGFQVPDRFLVGYGMDYGERYRHLPALYFMDRPPEAPLS